MEVGFKKRSQCLKIPTHYGLVGSCQNQIQLKFFTGFFDSVMVLKIVSMSKL